MLAYSKKYREQHKERMAMQTKAWYEERKHLPYIKERRNEYYKNSKIPLI